MQRIIISFLLIYMLAIAPAPLFADQRGIKRNVTETRLALVIGKVDWNYPVYEGFVRAVQNLQR